MEALRGKIKRVSWGNSKRGGRRLQSRNAALTDGAVKGKKWRCRVG